MRLRIWRSASDKGGRQRVSETSIRDGKEQCEAAYKTCRKEKSSVM